MTGMFIAIDGPGGVGKSTVTKAVVAQARAAGIPVHQTREPSDTTLGQLARHGTDEYRDMALACLIAADRYQHQEREIRPALARGDLVVSDRHVASSLVFQVLDGVGRDIVWELNRHADMPDISVVLNARADVIAQRLSDRGAHSRYEREAGGTERECALFREAARFLMASGVRVLQLDASSAGSEEVARTIVTAIKEMWTRGRS
ncbi:dTMP kinase [Streptomyces sp. NPDC021218]|uniref:dTMP kinase n=1 Tax=Streptomyces sp. NPDC021218 TaxID=3365119 RepID=UPI003791BF7D